MIVEDLTVEVRDRSLARVGQIRPEYLGGAVFVRRLCDVGSWELTLPAVETLATGEQIPHALADALRAEGAGLIVTGPQGVLLSGPTTEFEFVATSDAPEGVWTIRGVSDVVLLQDALAYPDPSVADPAAQTEAYDRRTGSAEDLLRQYVAANVSNASIAGGGSEPGAPAGRLAGFRQRLRLRGMSQGRGPVLTGSARFRNLLELSREIASAGELVFDVVQSGDVLEFVVEARRDRSGFVRMDVDNEQIATVKFGGGAPTTTVAVVAGQGEGAERAIVPRTSTAAAESETLWGRRIERFIDQRQADDPAELAQKGDEIVSAEGTSVTSASVTPSDDLTASYLTEWRVGDVVGVVIRDTPAEAQVSEATIVVSEAGVLVGARVGDPTGFDPEDLSFQAQRSTESRVSSLERADPGIPEAAVLAMLATLLPAGTVTQTARSTAPDGWLLCQGQTVSRTAYPALFEAIGTTYGAGDGSTTFALPDFRGRVPVGVSTETEFDALGKAGGSKTHTLTVAEMPSHNHTQSAHSHSGTTGQGNAMYYRTVNNHGTSVAQNHVTGWEGSLGYVDRNDAGWPLQDHTHNFSTNSQTPAIQSNGGGDAHNNLQPYRAINYQIKT